MKRRYAALFLGFLFTFPALCQAEDPTVDDAREQYKEVLALRDKQKEYMNEMGDLQREGQTASPERRKELETEFMLKQRALDRMTPTVQEKEQKLYDMVSKLIPEHKDDAELRQMRYECAFNLRRFEEVLEDIKFIPKEKHDSDFMMIWAKSLEDLYRFDEAAGIYKKALDMLDEDQKLYATDRLGFCHFNAMNFDKAKDYFLKLAEAAPANRKQQMEQLVFTTGQHVKLWEDELTLRASEEEKGDNPIVLLQVDKGEIKLELFEDQAPNTVANFITLVEQGFYDGIKFHRVEPQFMVQGGDPQGTGRGGPGYKIADECRQPNARRHFVGSLSMANAGPNTGGSQFFLTTVVAWWLDGKHTVFGRVLEGQEVVNKTAKNDLIIKAKVLRKRDHDYAVKKL